MSESGSIARQGLSIEAKLRGFDHHVTKPVDAVALEELVRAL